MFGDDPLALERFTECMPPPKVGLHPNIDKQQTTNMLFHIKIRVRC
jgi:hypothetical protein